MHDDPKHEIQHKIPYYDEGSLIKMHTSLKTLNLTQHW